MSTLTAEDILFFIFAIGSTISAFLVVLMSSPVYSALFLALTMSLLGAIFFTLQGYFIAAAQITVYAGAVMVLFVMVLMLFDLRREHEDVFKLSPMNIAKIGAATLVCAFLVGAGWLAIGASADNPATQAAPGVTQKDLGKGDQGLPATGSAAATQAAQNPPQVDSTNHETATGAAEAATTANPDDDLTNAEAKKLVEQSPSKDTAGAPTAATTGAIKAPAEEFGSTVSLSERLFSKYVFAFEAVSLLLLVAIVGAVALARSKGGTHHVA